MRPNPPYVIVTVCLMCAGIGAFLAWRLMPHYTADDDVIVHSNRVTATSAIHGDNVGNQRPLTLVHEEEALRASIANSDLDLSVLAPRAAHNIAVLSKLIESEKDTRLLTRMMRAYSELVGLTGFAETPLRLPALANHPDFGIQVLALEIAARCNDEGGQAVLLDALGTAQGANDWTAAIRATRFSRSANVLVQLNSFLLPTGDTLRALRTIESLQHCGDIVNIKALQNLAAETSNSRLRMEAQAVLEFVGVLALADRDDRLLGFIREPVVSGAFSSSRWALTKLAQYRANVAPQLRQHFMESQHLWKDTGPASFRVEILDVIRRLEGPITGEEKELLRRAGRIP
jgi:hypothetical protein